MAGKKGMKHTLISSPARIAEIRAKINAIRIIEKLNNHVLENSEMSATQMKAAEILLRKCVPDLSAVELTGEGGGPVRIIATSHDENL